jgi:hypothetical protein
MHACKVSHKILFNTLPWIHLGRLNALHECVLAAIDSQRLSVTGIGRSINSSAKLMGSEPFNICGPFFV